MTIATLYVAAKEIVRQIDLIKAAFGAPGDWGYSTREGEALYELYRFQAEMQAAAPPVEDTYFTDRSLPVVPMSGAGAAHPVFTLLNIPTSKEFLAGKEQAS